MFNIYIKTIILLFILYLLYTWVHNSDILNLKCVISSIDGNEYCVRDRELTHKAVDLLAITVNKCNKLIKYLKVKKPDHPITKLLIKGYNPTKIQETLPTSTHTAYSENKGEKLAFCLSKNNKTRGKINRYKYLNVCRTTRIITYSYD